VIAEQDDLAIHDLVDALARVGAVADDVAQAINLRDALGLDVRKDSGQRFEIAVDIADQRFHFFVSPRLGGSIPTGSRRSPTCSIIPCV
jgi:hypothetical protein